MPRTARRVMNPGSQAAYLAGCNCPVFKNNQGEWAPFPPKGWFVNPECPVHEIEGKVDGTGTCRYHIRSGGEGHV